MCGSFSGGELVVFVGNQSCEASHRREARRLDAWWDWACVAISSGIKVFPYGAVEMQDTDTISDCCPANPSSLPGNREQRYSSLAEIQT